MSQVAVSFQMDKDLKEQFEYFCSSVGMSMAVAFDLFVSAVLRERKIPFDIAIDGEIPNAETIAAMKEAARIARDPSVRRYSVEEALSELKR